MRIRGKRLERFLGIWCLVFIAAILYNEYIIFLFQSFKWANPKKCTNQLNCTKILLVADPQILGDMYDTNFYAPMAKFDSDRNLRGTFNRAFKYSEPDIVIFLGDLMDEGSIADDDKFEAYFERFKNIFDSANSAYTIYIPGDNDIGGEGREPIGLLQLQHFRAFTDQSTWYYKNLALYHTNRITSELPRSDVVIKNETNRNTVILLSHYPILHAPGPYSEAILKKYHPNLIFSAHSHVSTKILSNEHRIFNSKSHTLNFDLHNLYYNWSEFDLTELRQAEEYLEIMVPTCSYRMGFKRIGYGMAILDNHSLHYTVLWMPNRFIQLISYIILISIPVFYLFSKFVYYSMLCLIRKLAKCSKRPKYLPV